MHILEIAACVYAGLVIIGFCLFSYKIAFWSYGFKKQSKLPTAPQDKKFAILVPARDESKVISELLESIKRQTYNQELLHTYVIVADANDKTIEICKNYDRTTSYCLPKKVNSKGATLQQMIKKLYAEGERFDGYFIFDADNVLAPDFIEIANNCMQAGNDVVLGGRLNKKPSAHWINCGSTLTWSYLNTLCNIYRSEKGKNINIQGSPLLVSKTIIEDFWGGDWPLTSLTEDEELSFICDIYNFKSYYCDYALAYDEQPTKFKQSVNQRLRWVKGHFDVHKKYGKQFKKAKCKYQDGFFKIDKQYSLVGPIIIVVSTVLFSLLCAALAIWFSLIGDPMWINATAGSVVTFVGTYLLLCLWTLIGLLADRKKLNLSFWQSVRAVLGVPIFYITYIPIFFKAIFAKNVEWKKIDHNQSTK